MTAVIIPFPKPKSMPTPGEVLDRACAELGDPVLTGKARRLALGLWPVPQARTQPASR